MDVVIIYLVNLNEKNELFVHPSVIVKEYLLNVCQYDMPWFQELLPLVCYLLLYNFCAETARIDAIYSINVGAILNYGDEQELCKVCVLSTAWRASNILAYLLTCSGGSLL